jgi:hypothetical protein
VAKGGRYDGAIDPHTIHSFADNLGANAVRRQMDYSQDEQLQFVEARAATILASRHQHRCITDNETVTNLFGLPTKDFCARLKLLFPKIKPTESLLDTIRGLSKKTLNKWWQDEENHLEPFITEVITKLDFMEKGAWKKANGGLCTSAEFPEIKKAFYSIFLPDSKETEDNKRNPQWLTNRRLLDEIAADPPDDLNELFQALLDCGGRIAVEYATCQRSGWMIKADSDQGHTKKSKKANWTPCPKCNKIHHFNAACSDAKAKKDVQTSASSSQAASSSQEASSKDSKQDAAQKDKKRGFGRDKKASWKRHKGTHVMVEGTVFDGTSTLCEDLISPIVIETHDVSSDARGSANNTTLFGDDNKVSETITFGNSDARGSVISTNLFGDDHKVSETITFCNNDARGSVNSTTLFGDYKISETINYYDSKKIQEIDLVSYIQPMTVGGDLTLANTFRKRGRVPLDSVNINKTESDIELINNITDHDLSSSTVPMVLVNQYPTLEHILIDSGSIKSNYIDVKIFDRLKSQGVPTIPLKKKRRVCSGLAGVEGQSINEYMEVLLVYIDELTNKEKSIVVQVHPVAFHDSSFSIIIGLPMIQMHRLASKFPSIFENKKYDHMKYFRPLSQFKSEESLLESQERNSLTSDSVIRCTDHALEDVERCTNSFSSTASAQPERQVPAKSGESQDSDAEEVEEPLFTRFERQVRDTLDTYNVKSDEVLSLDALLTMVQLFGPPSLQSKLTKLLSKYIKIFSLKVSTSPAKVDVPMEIIIDKARWESSKNQLPPRLQSQLKEAELQKQVEGLLATGVIRRSKARFWSQVHLTPKPTPGEWRFCIDYRRLNAITLPTESHPLPRIDHMLQRLGRRKAKYFGVIDLTAGYHQVPLSPEAIPLTAFICFMGIFEFVRLPFGLANAVSYFQCFIATVVLAELMYKIVENYIDDVIVTGQEEDDFVSNVEAVFIKFEEHFIKVNPRKVKLGLHQVECVGHVVDGDGLHFSRSKLDSVLNFKKPEYAAQMKSFLGLCNYFRDHVKNYSELSRPLNDMVAMNPYNRRNKLIWTPETTLAYETLKIQVHECPKLFFLLEHCPIHLYTDASDYGIGAYLTQIIEGKEVPIAFISKTLSKSQRKWSTPEKECFAIYYSLVKLEYLLLDQEFIIHTDHKNLTFLDESANARVNRWKLALQEYKFTIEYIKGADNIVADSFSRLCLLTEELSLSEDEMLAVFEEDDIDQVNSFNSTSWSYPQEYADILGKFHNSEVGHFGVEKTVNKLLSKGYRWEHMRKHVKAFVKKCPCCQVMSQIKPAIHTLPFTTSTYNPMDSLNVDTIGPLPSDEYGNTYILVVIDRFSRWIELYAMRDATAKSAAISLIAHFGRYGAANELRSDGGSQFVNEIIAQVLLLIGTHHEITLAHSKQENAIVERSNKEVIRHLRNTIFDKRVLTTWSIFLPWAQRTHNSTIHSALGVSPAQILFGNAIDLDRNLFPTAKEFSITYSNLTLSQYASDLLAAQDIFIKVAQEHQLAKNEKHLQHHERYMKHEKYREHYEASITDQTSSSVSKPTVFPVNSYVLVAYPENGFTKRARPPTKFMPEWKGPYQVISFVGSSYKLLNLVTMKEEDGIHVKRLKEFIYEEGTDPRAIANQAADTWDVERIISHKGKPYDSKRRDTKKFMSFEVKWVGFEEPTWEPYTNRSLFKTEAMHNYLRDNNLKSLIPASYRK